MAPVLLPPLAESVNSRLLSSHRAAETRTHTPSPLLVLSRTDPPGQEGPVVVAKAERAAGKVVAAKAEKVAVDSH